MANYPTKPDAPPRPKRTEADAYSALNQLADDLDAEQKDIADAVTANTTTPPTNPAA